MTFLAEYLRRVWYLLNRTRFEDALRTEMETHRAMMGEPARFGNTLRLREEARDVWGWARLDDLRRDLRFALRALRRSPGASFVAIASLALATGATTAIFSVVDGVLLQPLPFADPDRLVQVFGRQWREDRGGLPDPIASGVASPELESYEQSPAFDGLAGYALTTRLLDGPAGPERLTAVQADLDFFAVLGVPPTAGRTFHPDDTKDVAVISARLWEQRFARDPSLPGTVVTLDGRSVTVLGVMPESFQFPYGAGSLMPGALSESRTDLWIPLESLRGSAGEGLRRGRVSVIGRLQRGVTREAANAELAVRATRVQEESGNPRIRVGVRVAPLTEVVLGPITRSLWMLFAAVALVLAAACANVANLLLSQMPVRTREVVTRAALGASPRRLVRQFLTEGLLLSLAGGIGGIAIAWWGSALLVAQASSVIPRAHEVAVDWRVFSFLLVICLATAGLFGLAPALAAARVDVAEGTRSSGGHATMGGRYGRVRDGLVVLEVALAFVLALGAAAVLREVMRLRDTDTGMVTENVLTLHITPRAPAQDYYTIEDRVARLPGVAAAGLTQLVPLQNWGWDADFAIRSRPADPSRPSRAELRYVTPGYFRALGIPVLRGRGFTPSDSADAPRVILINDALARQFFGHHDPVGVDLDRGTVVGVVGDVRQIALDRPAKPEIYYPAAQNVTMAPDTGMSLIVRGAGRSEISADAIRAAIREVNPRFAIFNVRTMKQVLTDSLWELHLYLSLVGLFAVLTVVLAAIGLYGVISYNVTSRRREFAVRLALGSDAGGLVRLVVLHGARLAGAGLGFGALAALALVLLLPRLPVTEGLAPAVYVGVFASLLALALVACLVPAVRVTSVNPATALRQD